MPESSENITPEDDQSRQSQQDPGVDKRTLDALSDALAVPQSPLLDQTPLMEITSAEDDTPLVEPPPENLSSEMYPGNESLGLGTRNTPSQTPDAMPDRSAASQTAGLHPSPESDDLPDVPKSSARSDLLSLVEELSG